MTLARRLLALALVASLRSGVSATPPDADARYRAGLGLIERDLHDLAIVELESYLADIGAGGVSVGEHETGARYALAVCLDRVGRREEAARELDQVLEAGAFEFLADALLLRARLACDAGQPEGALPLLERCASLDAAMAGTEYAMALRCEALVAAGRLHDARDSLDATIKAHPKAASIERLRYLSGRTAHSLGDGRRAVEELAACRELNPSGPLAAPAAVLEASIRLRGGDARGASEALAALPTPVPAELSDDVAYWLGASERRLGHAREAAERLRAAIERHPDGALRPDMQLELASAWADARDGRATDAFGAFVALAPQDARVPAALLAQASALAHAGRHADAERVCADLAERAARGGVERTILVSSALLHADCAFARGDDLSAEGLYASFIGLAPGSPQSPRALARRGRCLARLERPEEARACLTRALDTDALGDERQAAEDELLELAVTRADWSEVLALAPSVLEGCASRTRADEVRLRHAIALARTGDIERAIPALRSVAHDADDRAVASCASYELGRCLLARDDAREAEAAFRRCVDLGGADPATAHACLRECAAIAARDGRPDDARRALEELSIAVPDALVDLGASLLAGADFAAAEATLTRFLRTLPDHPRTPEAQARRAIALARLGRGDEALAESAAALRQPERLDAPLRSALRFERSGLLLARGESHDAERELAAVVDDPDARTMHAAALAELARRAFEARKPDRSLALATRAIEAAEGDAGIGVDADAIAERCLYIRGCSLAQLGRPREASDALRESIDRFPAATTRHTAMLVLGQSLCAAGDHERGAIALETLLAERAALDVPTLDLALLGLGQATAERSRWEDSERAYLEHRHLCPASERAMHALFGIGWARERQGRHDEAIRAYRELAQSHRGETAARAQFQIGECLYALGQHEDAVREFLRTDVLFGHPEWSAAALYEAGRCLRELGRADDAQRRFEELARRFPESRWTEAARTLPPPSGAADARRSGSEATHLRFPAERQK